MRNKFFTGLILRENLHLGIREWMGRRREVGGDDEGGKVGGFVVVGCEGVIEEEPAGGVFGGLGLGEIFC